MLKTGGFDPPDAALRPPQAGGEPLVRPAREPVFALLETGRQGSLGQEEQKGATHGDGCDVP